MPCVASGSAYDQVCAPQLLDDVLEAEGNVILFIDEIHLLVMFWPKATMG